MWALFLGDTFTFAWNHYTFSCQMSTVSLVRSPRMWVVCVEYLWMLQAFSASAYICARAPVCRGSCVWVPRGLTREYVDTLVGSENNKDRKAECHTLNKTWGQSFKEKLCCAAFEAVHTSGRRHTPRQVLPIEISRENRRQRAKMN